FVVWCRVYLIEPAGHTAAREARDRTGMSGRSPRRPTVLAIVEGRAEVTTHTNETVPVRVRRCGSGKSEARRHPPDSVTCMALCPQLRARLSRACWHGGGADVQAPVRPMDTDRARRRRGRSPLPVASSDMRESKKSRLRRSPPQQCAVTGVLDHTPRGGRHRATGQGPVSADRFAQGRDHVDLPGLSARSTHHTAFRLENEDGGCLGDVTATHQVETGLGVHLHGGDSVDHLRHVGQNAARGPARLAKGGGELHERGPVAQLAPDLLDREGITHGSSFLGHPNQTASEPMSGTSSPVPEIRIPPDTASRSVICSPKGSSGTWTLKASIWVTVSPMAEGASPISTSTGVTCRVSPSTENSAPEDTVVLMFISGMASSPLIRGSPSSSVVMVMPSGSWELRKV